MKIPPQKLYLGTYSLTTMTFLTASTENKITSLWHERLFLAWKSNSRKLLTVYLSFWNLIAWNREYSYKHWIRKFSLGHEQDPQIYKQKLTKLSNFQAQMKGLWAFWGTCLEIFFHSERYSMVLSHSSVGQKSHNFPVLPYLAVGAGVSQNLQQGPDLKRYYYSLNFISYMQAYKEIFKTGAIPRAT